MCVSELCEEKFARAINSPPEAYNKRSCVYYTTFAFYVSKMCDNIASKRLDACRMMIQ